jgi:hypothetical protein
MIPLSLYNASSPPLAFTLVLRSKLAMRQTKRKSMGALATG